MKNISFAGIELTSQRVRGLRGTSELPERPYIYKKLYNDLNIPQRGVLGLILESNGEAVQQADPQDYRAWFFVFWM